MEAFSQSFLFAGGPLLLVCFFFGWAPYFFNTSSWNDANFDDPIRIGLQSSLYSYLLVAGISASFPPCLELIFYTVVSRGNSSKRAILILTNMLVFISPELISLILVSPYSDSKLYFLLLNNRISTSIFFAMLLLCMFSEKSWRCKLSTVTVSFIYVGSLINSLAPYFGGIIGIWIQKFGSFLQFIGCLLFIIKSLKVLGTNAAATESQDLIIVDELLCKFMIFSVLFIIIGIFCVYLSAGLPYWTQWNSTYIACYNIILTLPNIIVGVIFAHATRKETDYLQHAKQMFVNYISHEMRTPLNTAVMGLQYLRSELVKAEANDEIMLTLDEVRTACETSVSILTEMLDFDKLQSGLMKMELEDLSVRDFLEDTISPFYVQARLKDIILEYNMNNADLNNLFVSGDKSKFAQVIRNLLSNALKFTPVGGSITVTTAVTPVTSLLRGSTAVTAAGGTTPPPSQQQLLKIEVIDNGAGISKENQKKLFNKMVQFNPGKLQSGGGTGLGLYSIMDLLHGTLSVKSEGEGHGCTFTVTTLAKYIVNTLNVELPEYKVEDNEKVVEERIAVRVGSTKSINCNNINNWTSSANSANNEILLNEASSSVEVSAGRLSKLRRTDSLRSIGITKVTPLLRTNSVRSFAGASACGEISQEDCQYGAASLKVLVVDDSRSNRKMLVRLLRSRCSVIGEAVDGVDAVNQIKAMAEEGGGEGEGEQRPYDAILMDFVMPNMEGPEAAREIRELGYQGLIIGITGNVLPVDKERFISQGANIVLTKPVNISDIDAAFTRILYPLSTTTSTMHFQPPFDV